MHTNIASTRMVDKIWPVAWACPPQLKDLPREGHIDVTCKTCRRQWRQSVRHMVETEHLGAEFVDLLEWQSRCRCGGMVCFAVDDGETVRHAA